MADNDRVRKPKQSIDLVEKESLNYFVKPKQSIDLVEKESLNYFVSFL